MSRVKAARLLLHSPGLPVEDGSMWTGKAIIQPGWAVFSGTAGDHSPHRHHAVQIALAPRGRVRVWAERGGRISAPGVVIGADCAHQLESGPAPLLLVYVERESVVGRALDEWCGPRARELSGAQCRPLSAMLAKPSAVNFSTVEEAVSIVCRSAPPVAAKPFADPRIAEALDALPRALPGNLTAATLARRSGLSPSRFAHLFRAHTGMPLRPYLRWLRLQQALIEIAGGRNLTDAAHAAGFSDSAHLSRTFRRTFGIAPQVLLHPALTISRTEA